MLHFEEVYDLSGSYFAQIMCRFYPVAEFKGPIIHGVVRFAQFSMELFRIEASMSDLRPGNSHGRSINEYGDLTRGGRQHRSNLQQQLNSYSFCRTS